MYTWSVVIIGNSTPSSSYSGFDLLLELKTNIQIFTGTGLVIFVTQAEVYVKKNAIH